MGEGTSMTEYHDHRDDCPFKFATLDVCDCVEKNMLDRIEALTEQLAAARQDAKFAEDELEMQEQEACMMENDYLKLEKERDALEAKLAQAVDWFETIRDRAKGDYMAHTYYLDAIAALATIKRREP
jgi:hypothetical protein